MIDLTDHLSEDYINSANNTLGFQEQSDLYMNHKSNTDQAVAKSNRNRSNSSNRNGSGGGGGDRRRGSGSSGGSGDDDAAYNKYRGQNSFRQGVTSFKKVHASATVV